MDHRSVRHQLVQKQAVLLFPALHQRVGKSVSRSLRPVAETGFRFRQVHPEKALGKALGGGIDFDLREAEICHTETGAPYFTFSGNLKDRLINDRVFLSISHDGGIASAICFVESDPVHPEGV